MLHLRLLLIIALIFFVFLANHSFAQQFLFTNNRKQQTISFDFIKNLIIIPIYINNKGPFDFILDTGVSPLIVIDPKLKEGLKIQYPRNIKISGYGNFDEIDAYLTATNVKIGDAEFSNMPSVFLKEDISSLSGFLGRKIYGIIGYHFFISFIVKVNYNSKTIKFISPIKKTKFKGEKFAISITDNKPYTNLQIEQKGIGLTTINALIDCGASHSLSLETMAKGKFPLPKNTIDGNLGVGLTNAVTGKIGRIERLHIGKFSFKNVLSNYPDYNIDSLVNKNRNANLGAEILSRFNITYDYRNNSIYLAKNSRFNDEFDYDMSGIELYKEEGPPARTFINKVEPNSPAETSGLKDGDEILNVNFKNVDVYALDEITNILKGKNGTNVIIEIWRNNHTFIKLIKLKKRI